LWLVPKIAYSKVWINSIWIYITFL